MIFRYKKIDLFLHKPGYEKVNDAAKIIFKKILESDGYIPLTDKSTPQDISDLFEMSKKTYKKAVGYLYKKQAIIIKEDGLYIAEQ